MKKGYSFYLMIGSLMLTAMLLLGMKYPAPLYSPGEIAEKHSKLGCSDCHAPFKRVPSESCSAVNCHVTGKIGKKDAVIDLHNRVKGQDCLACHTDHKGIGGKITLPFDHRHLPETARCIDCHQREEQKAHGGKYGERCLDCHTTKAWKPASFSHDKVTATPCVDCHRAAGEKAHKDKYGDACKGCHTTRDWKAISFSHDKVTQTPCADCHRAAGEKAHPGKYGDLCGDCHNTKKWKEVTFSHDRVAATPCIECHKGPKDDLHASAGSDCKGCHTTKAWKPATLDHDRYFPLDRDHKAACTKCHETKEYKVYTCMNCHVHATGGIMREHQKEGIRNFSDCLRCHRVYMKGRTYGTDKTGEGESMMDDEHGDRRGDRYGREGGRYEREDDDDD